MKQRILIKLAQVTTEFLFSVRKVLIYQTYYTNVSSTDAEYERKKNKWQNVDIGGWDSDGGGGSSGDDENSYRVIVT